MDNLKEKLAIQEIELKIKNDAADKLIQIVGIETEKVSKEKSFGMTLVGTFYILLLNIYKFYLIQPTKRKKKWVQLQKK